MGENGPAANDGGVKPRARLLVLAVDAGDKDLIMQWAREGVLPTFRSLLDTSAVAHTSNPARWPWSVAVEALLVVPHMANAPPVEAIGVAARSMSQQSHIRLSEEHYERAVEAIAGVAA